MPASFVLTSRELIFATPNKLSKTTLKQWPFPTFYAHKRGRFYGGRFDVRQAGKDANHSNCICYGCSFYRVLLCINARAEAKENN